MAELIYRIGKWVGFLASPGHILLAWLAVGAALLFAPKDSWRKAGRFLVAVGVGAGVVIAAIPFGVWGVTMLENRFPQPQLPPQVAGIIVLGGGEREEVAALRGIDKGGNGTMSRLLHFKLLAEKYPDATLVFAGGSSSRAKDKNNDLRQADIARATLQDMGLRREVIYENSSRTTYENAVNSGVLVGDKKKEPWILVTSAWHMPRAVGTFRKQGWNVIPYPVDYNTTGSIGSLIRISFVGNINGLNAVMRETIGMAGYWLTGRSDELFPGPR
ncbi:MAG: YdcF family protein [Alphaproteobacteria bacterium]